VRDVSTPGMETVLSHTTDSAYIFDLQGRLTYVNRAFLNFWRKSPQETVGKTLFELGFPYQLAAKLHGQIEQVIDSRKPLRDHAPYTGPAGRSGDYEYIFVPVVGPTGVEAVVGSTRDISGHTQMEATLRESEQRFRQLADAMPQIVWTATPDGALDYVNEQLTRYSGIARDAALGHGWFTLVHPADRKKTAERWQYSLATGEFYDTEFRVRGSDGSWRYHIVRAHARRDDSGQVAHWYGTCTDIQDQKDAERELAEARDRSRAILESITDAFLALDKGWCFTYLNRAAEEILQRSRQDLLGKNLWMEFAPTVHSKFGEECRRAVDEKVAVHFEEYFTPLNTWLAVHAYPSAEGLAVYFQDISEQKCAEAERELLVKELARSNSELQAFAHVAAHDLQSPLRMIKIYAQLLEAKLQDRFDDSSRALMETVLQGADRMQQLVQGLLSYAQVDQAPRERHTVAMGSIVAEALSHLSPLVGETGAEIAVDELPTVQGDGVQLLQLIQNLITNAIKYRRAEQPPQIRISATQGRGEWNFAVRDNGEGIPEAYRAIVFQPLKRLHGHDVPGTGIGLAVCKRIVERHGGRIWIEQPESNGSTFLFTLAS
jgi:PAS domain S-box-containing protein